MDYSKQELDELPISDQWKIVHDREININDRIARMLSIADQTILESVDLGPLVKKHYDPVFEMFRELTEFAYTRGPQTSRRKRRRDFQPEFEKLVQKMIVKMKKLE